jgi:hypothetical protein
MNSFLEYYANADKQLAEEGVKLNPNDEKRIKRYITIQVRMLENLRNDPTKYWSKASKLAEKSMGFRLLALRNVRPNWYKDLSVNQLVRTWWKLDNIARNSFPYKRIERVAIPKADGTNRYLSVPSLENRLYAWLINYLLSIYFQTRLSKHQHGHRKGIGTVTAWKDILTNVKDCRYILELDYKDFHNSIDRRFLIESLHHFGVNEEWCERINHLNSPYVVKLDEKDPWKKDPGFTNQVNVLNPQDSFEKTNKWAVFKGVPQGTNTSALLGIVCLEYMKVYEGWNYVGYADDAVIGSEEPSFERLISRLDSIYSGITIKEKKTEYIKVDGKWRRELDFCGIRWTLDQRLRAHTKSGKDSYLEWKVGETDWLKLKKFIISHKPIDGKHSKVGILSKNFRILDWQSGWEVIGTIFAKAWSGVEKSIKITNLKDGSLAKIWETFFSTSKSEIEKSKNIFKIYLLLFKISKFKKRGDHNKREEIEPIIREVIPFPPTKPRKYFASLGPATLIKNPGLHPPIILGLGDSINFSIFDFEDDEEQKLFVEELKSELLEKTKKECLGVQLAGK